MDLAPPLPSITSPPRRDMNYTSLFNQLFGNTLQVQCICKTSKESMSIDQPSTSSSNVFDHGNDDFMDDTDDTHDNRHKQIKLDKICDLTCFEIMKYTHYSLKNCMLDDQVDEESQASAFNQAWSMNESIQSHPESCDYNGTTLFHLSACDNSVQLLKLELSKCPSGIHCTDAKGMTPLMRAVQRNNIESVKYLLNETKSDINGNQRSIYTPLWLSVSNGLDEMCLVLLNFNASTRYVNKMAPASTSLLLSPLRASIVYSKYQIMKYLLEFDADVSEIFIENVNNESYLSGLKLYYRHFGANRNDTYLNILHSFTPSPNIYKSMLVALLKSITSQLNRFSQELNVNGLDYDSYLRLIDRFESNSWPEIDMSTFLTQVSEFIDSVDVYLTQTARAGTFAIYPGYSQLDLLKFAIELIRTYYRPLSLKELCRFRFRKILFERVNCLTADQFNSTDHRKIDHLNKIVDKIGLPNYFKEYTLRFSSF